MRVSLDEFLDPGYKGVTNIWLKEPGWRSLYVRKGPRYIGETKMKEVLDLANFEAKKPGTGTLRRLLERLVREHPKLTIFVESVLEERLREFFRQKTDFSEVLNSSPACFYLKGKL